MFRFNRYDKVHENKYVTGRTLTTRQELANAKSKMFNKMPNYEFGGDIRNNREKLIEKSTNISSSGAIRFKIVSMQQNQYRIQT